MELKQIPGTIGFLADEDGNIYSSDGQKRNTYQNGDGYITASVKLLDGRWVTFGVHRLTALAHIEIPDFDSETGKKYSEVNHRDGNIKNNKKSNLEWVTSSENNIHSEIMRQDNQYPTIIGQHTPSYKEVVLFRNVHAAETITGIPKLKIWDAIRYNDFVIAPNHISWKFQHQPWDGLVPEVLKKPTLINRDVNCRATKRPIKLMDVDTGDIVVFASFADAGKHFNTSPSHLHISIPKNERIRLFRKQYQVAYADDDFPEISQEDLDKAKGRGPKDTLAYCIEDNSIVICSNAKELIELLKLSKKIVTKSLAENKFCKVSDGVKTWIVTYFEGQKSIEQIKAYVKGPASA